MPIGNYAECLPKTQGQVEFKLKYGVLLSARNLKIILASIIERSWGIFHTEGKIECFIKNKIIKNKIVMANIVGKLKPSGI